MTVPTAEKCRAPFSSFVTEILKLRDSSQPAHRMPAPLDPRPGISSPERTARVRLSFPIPARFLSLSSRPGARTGAAPPCPVFHCFLSGRLLPKSSASPSLFSYFQATRQAHRGIRQAPVALHPRMPRHPSFSRHAPMSLPSRQRRGLSSTPEQGFFGVGGVREGVVFAQKTPLPPPQSRFQSPGRQCYPAAGEDICETRLSVRCVRLVCW